MQSQPCHWEPRAVNEECSCQTKIVFPVLAARRKLLRQKLLESYEHERTRNQQQQAVACLQAAVRSFGVRRLIGLHRRTTMDGFYSVKSSRCHRGPEHLRLALWYETAIQETDGNLQWEDESASVLQAAIRGRSSRSEVKRMTSIGRRVRRELVTTLCPPSHQRRSTTATTLRSCHRKQVQTPVQLALKSITDNPTHAKPVSPLIAAQNDPSAKLPAKGSFSNRSSKLSLATTNTGPLVAMQSLFTIHSG